MVSAAYDVPDLLLFCGALYRRQADVSHRGAQANDKIWNKDSTIHSLSN